MLTGSCGAQTTHETSQELLNVSSSSEDPEFQALREHLENEQDPAGDQKIKEYFDIIQGLYEHSKEPDFSVQDPVNPLLVDPDVISKLPSDLQTIVKDFAKSIAENNANLIQICAINSLVDELQSKWSVIQAIKGSLAETEHVLTLKDYSLKTYPKYLRLLSHVTELNITEIENGNILSCIEHLNNVQTIHIVDAERLANLSKIQYHPKVVSVLIENAQNFTSFCGIDALIKLQKIEVKGCRSTRIHLVPSRSVSSLQNVRINGCNVDWQSIDNFDAVALAPVRVQDEEEQLIHNVLPLDMPADIPDGVVAVLEDMLVNLPVGRLAGQLADVVAAMPNGLQDGTQDLSTTTTGGATASVARNTTSSIESVDSRF